MSDLPRLLLCCFEVIPAPTAISRRLTEYLKSLSDRYQVVVLAVKTPDHTHIERYHGARLLRVPVGSGDLAARVQAFDRAVRRQLDSEEYVMVHFFDPFGGYALCERRSEFGYKLVYDATALPSVELPYLVSEAEANRRFIARVRRQELYCLMNADAVVVGNDLTRDFVAGLGVAREQVQVIPAPVDLGPYDPKVMGTPDGTPMRLIHLGNQGAAQDLPTLLEALKLALASADVQLAVLGPKNDAHQARLEEQVAALGLAGKVEFQPPVPHDDLHKVLATADVGLLTLSDVERNNRVGTSLSRLGEYLAAGRPVIAADVASARALLPDDGVVLYRPGDARSLADAIVTLATDPAQRARLGAAARAAALQRDAAKIRADLAVIYVALSGTGVRAVGAADATTPDEVTQLGRSAGPTEDTQRRKLDPPRTDPPSGMNKVTTDPAIAAVDETSAEKAVRARPVVMGVPLREEEPPIVPGEAAKDLAAEFARVTTEPNALRPTEPPVVMGTPLATAPRAHAAAPTPGDLAQELGSIATQPPAAAPPTASDEAAPVDVDDPPTGPPLSLVPAPALVRADEPMTEFATPVAAPPVADEPPIVQALEAQPPSGRFSPPPAAGPPPTPAAPPASSPPPPPPSGGVPLLSMPPMPSLSPPPLLHRPAPDGAPPSPRPAADSVRELTPVGAAPFAPTRPTPSAPSLLPAPPPLPVPLSAAPVARTRTGSMPAFSPADAAPPAPARSATGSVPALAIPPAPARTSTGSFAAATAPPMPPAARPGTATGSGLFPTAPLVPSAPPRPGLATASSTGPEEISESEIEEVVDGDGPEEVGADEFEEVAEAAEAEPSASDIAEAPEESVMTVDTDPSPPPSAIDPWLAQLVHGYCPPESGLFERHTPPTTMPGRDT